MTINICIILSIDPAINSMQFMVLSPKPTRVLKCDRQEGYLWSCLALLRTFASPADGRESQMQTIQQHSVPSARWRPGTRSGKSAAIKDSVFLSRLQLSIKLSKYHVTSLGVSATTRFSVHNLKLKQWAPCTHTDTHTLCAHGLRRGAWHVYYFVRYSVYCRRSFNLL